MRVPRGHPTAPSFVRHGHGQQRGMPSIPCQREPFRQTHLETGVGVVGKLVGGVADQRARDALYLVHDAHDAGDGGWPFIATGPLSVCCVGHVPPTNGRSTVWDENTLVRQCWETPAAIPAGSSRFFWFIIFFFFWGGGGRVSSSCAWVDDAWRIDVVFFFFSGPKAPH